MNRRGSVFHERSRAFRDEQTGCRLKGRDDEGTVLVHGGPDFAASLTRLGLVDEYHLSTVPIAIGAGRSPFANLDEHLKLEVVEEQRFRSGALAQVLVPKR